MSIRLTLESLRVLWSDTCQRKLLDTQKEKLMYFLNYKYKEFVYNFT